MDLVEVEVVFVNLGSTAGHYTYPNGNVYCATKAAVRVISEG